MVYDGIGDDDKFSIKNYGLGRSCFHATVTCKLKQKTLLGNVNTINN